VKFNQLRIDGFGVWRDFSLDDLSEHVTLVYGPNEAGKTTLMQFVRAMLYGFNSEQRSKYLLPLEGDEAGGRLSVTGTNGRFEVHRTTETTDNSVIAERVRVIASDGTVQGEHLLPILLSNVDEAVFNNVFSVGLSEIQQLATLSDTEAAQHLYNLTTGLDRVSIVDVQQQLTESRSAILAVDDGQSDLKSLLIEREQLSEQIEEYSQQTRRWAAIGVQRTTVDTTIRELDEERTRLDRQLRTTETAQQWQDRWKQRSDLIRRVDAIGALPDLSISLLEQIESLNHEIERRHSQCEEWKTSWHALRDEAAELNFNRKLWRQIPRIEAMGEQQAWISSLEDQTARLDAEVSELSAELRSRSEGLSIPQNQIPDLSRDRMDRLRGPARRIREQRSLLADAKKEVEVQQGEAEANESLIQDALAARNERDLSVALEKSGSLVSQLRRRIKTDERLEQMIRDRHDLDEQNADLQESQLLPLWQLAGIGFFFALGVVLLVIGLFYYTSGVGWLAAILGLGGMAGSIAAKVFMERSARQRLATCQQQLQLISAQIQQAEEERESLDKSLPRGSGPLASRLIDAQREVGELEELLPLETQHQAARGQAQAAQRRVHESRERLDTARGRWRKTLRSLDLPETLSPAQVRNLASEASELSELTRRLESRREELSQRQSELRSLATRIEQLANDVELSLKATDVLGRLREMLSLIATQEQIQQHRSRLVREGRQLKKKHQKTNRGMKRLRARRLTLLAQANVSDERQLGQLLSKLNERQSIEVERDQIEGDLRTAIDGVCTEAGLEREIKQGAENGFSSRIEQLEKQRTHVEKQWRSQCERRGGLMEQIKTLENDTRLADIQLELSAVEKKISGAISEWQVLALTESLLAKIRHEYETERQPETLTDASKHLERLTEGQYVRVWTPLGQQTLKVDDSSGHSLPIEVLSRGTREQVFFALRLALVSSYARRGAVLPLILDDVLVNFDNRRAKAAVGVLRDFARQGHQVLVFTCHEHVMKLFKAAKVAVCMLPDRSERHEARIDEPDQEILMLEEGEESEVELNSEEEETLDIEDDVEEYESDEEDYLEDDDSEEDEEEEDEEEEDDEAEEDLAEEDLAEDELEEESDEVVDESLEEDEELDDASEDELTGEEADNLSNTDSSGFTWDEPDMWNDKPDEEAA